MPDKPVSPPPDNGPPHIPGQPPPPVVCVDLPSWQHWKTTTQGILSLLVVIGLSLLGSGSPLISYKVTLWITLGLGVAKAVLGFLQNDAR